MSSGFFVLGIDSLPLRTLRFFLQLTMRLFSLTFLTLSKSRNLKDQLQNIFLSSKESIENFVAGNHRSVS